MFCEYKCIILKCGTDFKMHVFKRKRTKIIKRFRQTYLILFKSQKPLITPDKTSLQRTKRSRCCCACSISFSPMPHLPQINITNFHKMQYFTNESRITKQDKSCDIGLFRSISSVVNYERNDVKETFYSGIL